MILWHREKSELFTELPPFERVHIGRASQFKTMKKCKYNGKSYEIIELACETVRIKNEEEEICLHKDNIKPTNKEARDYLNGKL